MVLKGAKGQFITVEGGEGSGKSSNIAFVKAWLEERGVEVVSTREPGGTPFAEEIRELLLRKRDEVVDELSELLLMFAARSQHLNSLILPALERGAWVICDRFTDATYAYQGGGRGVDVAKISQLETLVQGELRPDLVLLLDVDPNIGMSRAQQRGELDRFESEKLEFFQRIRRNYLARAEQFPNSHRVINSGAALADVQQEIGAVLSQFFDDVKVV